MKKFILTACVLVVLLFAGYYAYYHMGLYVSLGSDEPVETFMKTDEDTIYMEREGRYEPFEIRGVNLGAGIPGEWATDYAIDEETYLRWFNWIQELGANTIRVYTILQDDFYNAFYAYNNQREAEGKEPLWLLHGVWINDYIQNSHRDAFDDDFLQTFLDERLSPVFSPLCGVFLYLVYHRVFQLPVSVGDGGASELYAAKRRNRLKNELENDYYVPVSIVVPAHNEEVTIESTIRSLLALDYKLYEIIVVDDGSTDNTSEVLKKAFRMWPVGRPIQRRIPCQPEEAVYESRSFKVPITLVRKKNGGKADALNMGINAANYPYFLCMDADSVLQYDSLEKIVRPVLEDSSVVAVGGTIRPCNGAEIESGRVVRYRMPKKLLPCMQVLEYDRSFLASRILFDRFNGNIIISGAFGLFQKNLVIAAGGYDSTTMGEDMELVVKLHVYCRENNRPYRIRYASDAVCWTQVPETMGDLCRQRRRWHIGLFQSMMKYRNIMANPKYGLVSYISYFYFLLYELFSPYIEVFGVFTTLLAFAVDLINVPFMILFFGIYVVYTALLSLTAFFARIYTIDLKLYPSDVVKAVGLCVAEVSCLRFILAWVRMTALIGYRKKKHSWGRIERQKIEIK